MHLDVHFDRCPYELSGKGAAWRSNGVILPFHKVIFIPQSHFRRSEIKVLGRKDLTGLGLHAHNEVINQSIKPQAL